MRVHCVSLASPLRVLCVPVVTVVCPWCVPCVSLRVLCAPFVCLLCVLCVSFVCLLCVLCVSNSASTCISRINMAVSHLPCTLRRYMDTHVGYMIVQRIHCDMGYAFPSGSFRFPFGLFVGSFRVSLWFPWDYCRVPFVVVAGSLGPFGRISGSLRIPFGLPSGSLRAPFGFRSGSLRVPANNYGPVPFGFTRRTQDKLETAIYIYIFNGGAGLKAPVPRGLPHGGPQSPGGPNTDF